ncbi:hypothetical protein V8C44DRAFT_330391 [Trichoderma aethiopicum]
MTRGDLCILLDTAIVTPLPSSREQHSTISHSIKKCHRNSIHQVQCSNQQKQPSLSRPESPPASAITERPPGPISSSSSHRLQRKVDRPEPCNQRSSLPPDRQQTELDRTKEKKKASSKLLARQFGALASLTDPPANAASSTIRGISFEPTHSSSCNDKAATTGRRLLTDPPAEVSTDRKLKGEKNVAGPVVHTKRGFGLQNDETG